MKTFDWNSLSPEQRQTALARPAVTASASIDAAVADVIAQVRSDGDAALKALTAKFDGVELDTLRVSDEAIAAAEASLSTQFKAAVAQAYQNVSTFHKAQQFQPLRVVTQPGVVCELVNRPIQSVGLYIPGGTAPLPSTVLMLAIPAQIAGCPRRVLVSPPNIAPEILYTAKLCGITEIYQIGGSQAIAALAYGTESIAKVDKIYGPGNSYVTAAKQQVSQDPAGAAIDMPAGPSEVLVLADEQAKPEFIAADLLSQAEHGADSQVVLVTPSTELAAAVDVALEQQLAQLSRREIAEKAIANSVTITCRDLSQAVEISNAYAPEHLIVQTRAPRELLDSIVHAGSVFLGDWTPESVGDYSSGTNHVLPTYGYVRTYSSLNLADFCKRFTVQELSPAGLRGLADSVTTIAAAEGLDAHLRAVTVRTDYLANRSAEESGK